jgi:hypothetical protein
MLAFARARALQAPLTFVGISGLVTWYGVYDLSYLTSSTVLRNFPERQPLSCRIGGHAAGCAVGAAVVAVRFPQAALVRAVSRGAFMQAPWTEAMAVLAGSAGVAGLVGAGTQRWCGHKAAKQ